MTIACVSTLSQLSELVGPKMTATNILQVVAPLLVEENLAAAQFREILQTFRHLISKVCEPETE